MIAAGDATVMVSDMDRASDFDTAAAWVVGDTGRLLRDLGAVTGGAA